jgi:hypothetical protein
LRAEASIKEREKEVQRTLATHLRDRDKERQHHQRDEAIRHFNALLADLVRNPDFTWKEVKKLLKKDHRYEMVEMLDRDDRERIFMEHIQGNFNNYVLFLFDMQCCLYTGRSYTQKEGQVQRNAGRIAEFGTD